MQNESLESKAPYPADEPLHPADPAAPFFRRPSILFTLMILLGGMLWAFVYGRQEMANWNLAAAQNALIDGQYAQAIESVNAGLTWQPDDAQLLVARATAWSELKEYEKSLADLDRMIALAGADETTNEADMRPREAKTAVLQDMGRFQEAVDVWTEIIDFRREQFDWRQDSESRYSYALALNNRSYVQALGRIEIEQALQDIRQAIEIRGRDDDPVMVDTLGYLELLHGDVDSALIHLESALELALLEDAIMRDQLTRKMQQVVDQRPFEEALERMDQNLAVITHHRGEAYEALGEQEKADADYAEAVRLGYNPDEGVW